MTTLTLSPLRQWAQERLFGLSILSGQNFDFDRFKSGCKDQFVTSVSEDIVDLGVVVVKGRKERMRLYRIGKLDV